VGKSFFIFYFKIFIPNYNILAFTLCVGTGGKTKNKKQKKPALRITTVRLFSELWLQLLWL